MKKAHNFPKDKVIICNEKHDINQAKEIFKLCFDYGVEISDDSFCNPIQENYPYFYYNQNNEFILNSVECSYGEVPVSFDQFKAFIRGEGKIEEEVKLGPNRWVFIERDIQYDSTEQRALVFYQGNENPTFGFTHYGNWSNHYGNGINTFSNPKYKYSYPTESEVLEALTKEAVKRGYKNGNYKCLSIPTHTLFTNESFSYDSELNTLVKGDSLSKNVVFKNGVWAEIIPSITKSEAETQLGKKIID